MLPACMVPLPAFLATAPDMQECQVPPCLEQRGIHRGEVGSKTDAISPIKLDQAGLLAPPKTPWVVPLADNGQGNL